jgi:hypothetical protein
MTDPKPVIVKLHPQPEEYMDGEDAFLRAVGACVTCWAFVDRQLFRLFRFGLSAPTHTASLSYYGQNTIGRSISQVDILLSSRFSGDDGNEQHRAENEHRKAGWARLKARRSDLIPVRNAIVHQPVKRTGKASDGKAVYEYAIYPEPYLPPTKRGRAAFGKKGELLTADLEKHAAEVQHLEADLKTFVRAINGRERSNEARTT